MKKILASLAIAASLPVPAFAQQLEIEHRRPVCIPSARNAFMTATVRSEGAARLYFRRRGTTDWCSVDGVKLKDVTTFVLPEFEPNVEVEYYIATIDDGKVTGRTPVLYRVRTSDRCGETVARHEGLIVTSCSEGGPGDVGTALGAGYMLNDQVVEAQDSPFLPEQ